MCETEQQENFLLQMAHHIANDEEKTEQVHDKAQPIRKGDSMFCDKVLVVHHTRQIVSQTSGQCCGLGLHGYACVTDGGG